MNRRILWALALATLFLSTLVFTVQSGTAQLAQISDFVLPRQTVPTVEPQPLNQDLPTACALQPERKGSRKAASRAPIDRSSLAMAPGSVSLSRFRSSGGVDASTALTSSFNQLATPYKPKEEIALIHPSNYGDRFMQDINGNPALYQPIVVLHETVGSAESAINFFRTPHPNDNDQASYHTLIRRNGTVVYLVPPDKRAFGAGNSIFKGVSVRTNPAFPGSVNNFAYHISLETPPDGRGNSSQHSGYTKPQYQSLAWLIAKTGVSDDNITTHRLVDRSNSRIDPRSFRMAGFMTMLDAYPRTEEISIRCTEPVELSAS
jgi:hypothetical protein